MYINNIYFGKYIALKLLEINGDNRWFVGFMKKIN